MYCFLVKFEHTPVFNEKKIAFSSYYIYGEDVPPDIDRVSYLIINFTSI